MTKIWLNMIFNKACLGFKVWKIRIVKNYTKNKIYLRENRRFEKSCKIFKKTGTKTNKE
jgi:hypothetical protein